MSQDYNTVPDRETIELKPFEDWVNDMPQIRNDEGELVDKFRPSLRNLGYKMKTPTRQIVRKLRRSFLKAAKTEQEEDISAFVRYLVSLIVDWFEIEKSEDAEKSLKWKDAKKEHQAWIFREDAISSRIYTKYIEYYGVYKKKEDDDFLGL